MAILRNKTLVDYISKNYVAEYIDANKFGIEFGVNGGDINVLHTDGDGIPRWNGIPLALGEAQIATKSVLGSVIIGDRISVDLTGKITADHPLWVDIVTNGGTAPDVGIFNNNVNYQTKTEVDKAIEDALEEVDTKIETALEDYVVQDVEFDETEHKLTFSLKDKPKLEVLLPTLDIIKNVYYDSTEKALMFVKKDDTEFPVDVADLIDIYTGVNENGVTVSVSSDNKISALINNGSIVESKLHTDLSTKINNKIDKDETAEEDNIAVFTDDGQVKDSGVSVKDILDKIEEHDHDGTNSDRVKYSNLSHKPVKLFAATSDGTAATTFSVGTLMYNVEYVVVSGSDTQTGVVKVRPGLPLMEMDVFGDDLEVKFSTMGGALTVSVGDNSEVVDIKLLVFSFTEIAL